MCTAINFTTDKNYFGRNLDLEISYGQAAVVTGRGHSFPLRHGGLDLAGHTVGKDYKTSYAIIGIAAVFNGVPLFFDGANEKGLGMAGLNFPGNAVFHKPVDGRDNIATFEFIPWILGQCATLEDAEKLLSRINLTDEAFSENLQPAELHWMITDGKRAIVIESMKDGLHIHENPVGVLTNNPPFEKQIFNLNNYRQVSARAAAPAFAPGLELDEYSRGMGSDGLPGGMSSMERFVKVAFVKLNSYNRKQKGLPVKDNTEIYDEKHSVSQFFHILHAVEQPMGCCELRPNVYEYTIYSDCMNLDDGILYYTTYENQGITAVRMQDAPLDGGKLTVFKIGA